MESTQDLENMKTFISFPSCLFLYLDEVITNVSGSLDAKYHQMVLQLVLKKKYTNKITMTSDYPFLCIRHYVLHNKNYL